MAKRSKKRGALNPAALSIEQLAGVLTGAGAGSGLPAVTPEMVRLDLQDGAPINADQTMNLLHYTAWLARTIASGGKLSD